jgi:hypothetical protein
MHTSKRRLRSVLLTVALIIPTMGTPHAVVACGPLWTPMPVDTLAIPNVSDVVMQGDAGWIVGYRPTARPPEPKMLSWDGTAWTRVSLPDLGTEAWLDGVDARTASDAWVVGYHVPDGNRRLLTLHWDGTAWTRIDALPLEEGRLRGVVVLAEDDVWAVGQLGGGTPLAIHWDGSSWTRSDLAALSGRHQILYGVHASGPDDVWAVGQWREPGQTQPLLIHRTDTGWVETVAPGSIGTYNTALYDVAAVRSGRAWAVGQESNGEAALVLRWNGAAWRRVRVAAHITSVWGVSFRGRRGWAVGRSERGPIALRWDAGAWTNDPPPEPLDTSMTMAAVDVATGGRTIAVGSVGSLAAPYERCD